MFRIINIKLVFYPIIDSSLIIAARNKILCIKFNILDLFKNLSIDIICLQPEYCDLEHNDQSLGIDLIYFISHAKILFLILS